MSTNKGKIVCILKSEIEDTKKLADAAQKNVEAMDSIERVEMLVSTLRLVAMKTNPLDREILDKAIKVFDDRIALCKSVNMLNSIIINNIANYRNECIKLYKELTE